MERLTDKIGNTYCVKGCGPNCKYGFEYCSKEDWENCQTISDVIDKLAEYEDLEEQGRLVKLPCKVGDDVYYILGIPNETPCAIDKCTFELSDINKIGKTLFLTKSEAEAKLKELRGGEDGTME